MQNLIQPGDTSELDAFLAANPDIEYIDAVFFDICGIARGKRLPRRDAAKLYQSGVLLPYSVYLLDVTGDCLDPSGRGFSDGDPDGTGWPVAGSLTRVVWAPDASAQVLMGMLDDTDAPAVMEPRNVLARVLERFAEIRLRPSVAFELEFYLIDRERAANRAPQPPISPHDGSRESTLQVYGLLALDAYREVIHDIERTASAMGLPATAATAEFAPGQFEINLHHVDDPLLAADHAALLRYLIKQVALCHGFDTTFMSKPFLDYAGNGMHIHLSLFDDTGRNVFNDGTAMGSDMGSKQLRHAIGGLAALLNESMAIFAPNLNAFRRLQPNIYVPVNPSWGFNNRSVAFRIPAGATQARRIEHRVAGADANPYLTLAAVLAGVHHGLKQRIDPGPPSGGNACVNPDPTLPRTWLAALDVFAEGSLLPAYLGREYTALYHGVKRAELAKFMGHISTLEYEWYL